MTTATKTTVRFLPYGRQHITESDIAAVVEVLRSDWLTQGPGVPAFEQALKSTVRAHDAVACANGTAALHLAMLALGIGPGDVVVTTPITFLATANCARYVGAEVQFVDVDPATGLMDIAALKAHLREDRARRIKAIVPVHFAGQPADLPAIRELAEAHGAYVVADACHAIGADYEDRSETYPVGCATHSDLTVFSFHPVKHVAMGEGGAVTTADPRLAARLRQFRNHGIERDARRMINKDQAFDGTGHPNPWYYEMHKLGYNYRLTDIQAALGLSQLRRLKDSITRRRELAVLYERLIAERFADALVRPLEHRPGRTHAYHLYVVRIDFNRARMERSSVMNRLREAGIGTQVHYVPVHLQPYYQAQGAPGPGMLPNAEKYYRQALSLPMYPDLTDEDVGLIVYELAVALGGVV